MARVPGSYATLSQVIARLAGVLYLLTIIGGLYAEVIVRGSLIAAHDPGRTAANILAHRDLYRSGLFGVRRAEVVGSAPSSTS